MSKPTPLSRMKMTCSPSIIVCPTSITAGSRGREYLIAFDSRFTNACFINPRSHATLLKLSSRHSMLRPEHSGCSTSKAVATSEFNGVICSDNACRPTCDKCSKSSTRLPICCAPCSTLFRYLRASAGSCAAYSSIRILENPAICRIGLRKSCATE